jgi:hypothetical protein
VAERSGDTFVLRNSQLAMLCGMILAGALIVAGSTIWLARSLG